MGSSLRRRRRTSGGVHCSLGSCGCCLFDRLVDGCLNQGLSQLVHEEHSFVIRAAVQQVLDFLLSLLKLLPEFYVVAAILKRAWGANRLSISPGFSYFFEPFDERERVPEVGRLIWLHKVRRTSTYRLSRSKSAGMLTGSPVAKRRVRPEGGVRTSNWSCSSLSCKIKRLGSPRWEARTNPQRLNRTEKKSTPCHIRIWIEGFKMCLVVTKHMGMQAIEHGRVPCDWSNKQWRVHRGQFTWGCSWKSEDIGQSSNKSCWSLTKIYFRWSINYSSI